MSKRYSEAKYIGYMDGSKKVRAVGFGVLGVALPVVAGGFINRKDPSERPKKHAAGFSEKYLGRESK